MPNITLYHGSAKKIENFDDNGWGMYFTPSIEIANEYICMQADNATGEYGFIYKVEIDENMVVTTEDIDQLGKCIGVLYSSKENYYRIDCPSKFTIIEMTDNEISQLLK